MVHHCRMALGCDGLYIHVMHLMQNYNRMSLHLLSCCTFKGILEAI